MSEVNEKEREGREACLRVCVCEEEEAGALQGARGVGNHAKKRKARALALLILFSARRACVLLHSPPHVHHPACSPPHRTPPGALCLHYTRQHPDPAPHGACERRGGEARPRPPPKKQHWPRRKKTHARLLPSTPPPAPQPSPGRRRPRPGGGGRPGPRGHRVRPTQRRPDRQRCGGRDARGRGGRQPGPPAHPENALHSRPDDRPGRHAPLPVWLQHGQRPLHPLLQGAPVPDARPVEGPADARV